MRSLRLLPLLLASVIAAPTIHAQINSTYWIEPGNGDFANAANWSDGLPSPTKYTLIQGAATVELDSAFGSSVGYINIINGTLQITGAGALTLSSELPGFDVQAGALVVSNGGSLTNLYSSVLGDFIGHGGSALVTGTESQLRTVDLWLGYGDGGSLTVTDHGAVTSTTLRVGSSGGPGTVAVTDHGTLQATHVFVGEDPEGANVFGSANGQGAGTLTVATGGRISASNLTLASMAPSTGTLNLDSGGTLAIGGENGLSGGEGTAHVNFDGGTLEVSGSALTSSVDINLATTSTIDTPHLLAASLSGQLVGDGGLIKAGLGTLTLTGNNTFGGATTISAGTLQVGEGGTTGAIAGDIVNDATLVFDRSNDFNYAGTISGTGAVIKNGAGTLTVSDTNAPASVLVHAGGLTVSTNGTLNAATLTVADIAGSIGSFTVSGGGTANLGSVYLGNAFGSGPDAARGSMEVTGDNSRIDVTGDLRVGLGQGSITIANGGTLSVDGTVVLGDASFTGDGPVVMGRFGTGTLTLNPGGTLRLGGEEALRAGGSFPFSGIAVVNLAGGTLQVANTALTTALNATLTNTTTIDTSAFLGATFSGVLSGVGSLTKTGAGTLTFSAENLYSGATTISGGTLALGAGGSLTSSSIAVAAGATFDTAAVGGFTLGSGKSLSGSGSVAGLFTTASGAHLAPGSSPGTLTFSSGLTLLSGTILDFELGSTSDRIDVTGGLLTGPTGTGGLTLNLADAGDFNVLVSGTYPLFNFVEGGTSGFDIADFAFGSLIPGTTAANFAFEFTATSLNLNYTASAVPEPSTYAALFGSGALALAIYRKRRHLPRQTA